MNRREKRREERKEKRDNRKVSRRELFATLFEVYQEEETEDLNQLRRAADARLRETYGFSMMILVIFLEIAMAVFKLWISNRPTNVAQALHYTPVNLPVERLRDQGVTLE